MKKHQQSINLIRIFHFWEWWPRLWMSIGHNLVGSQRKKRKEKKKIGANGLVRKKGGGHHRVVLWSWQRVINKNVAISFRSLQENSFVFDNDQMAIMIWIDHEQILLLSFRDIAHPIIHNALFMDGNKISKLEANAFKGVRTYKIDLSNNQIGYIHAGQFDACRV